MVAIVEPAQRAVAVDVGRVTALRGIVMRAEIELLLELNRSAPIVELRGGAGWGKTSAALAHAAVREARGATVVMFETGGAVRISRSAPDAEILYVVDDRELDRDVVEQLLDSVQRDRRVRMLVCSRGRHPLTDRAQSIGLVTRRIDLSAVRFSAAELCELARTRDVVLDLQRAEYVSHAIGGWPVVAAGFVSAYAAEARDSTVATIDRLIGRSFEDVLGRMVGTAALPLLARASLSGSISRSGAGQHGDAGALRRLIDRIHLLGLGEWVAA